MGTTTDLERGRTLRLVASERTHTLPRATDEDAHLDAGGLDPLDGPALRYQPRHGRRVRALAGCD